MLNLRQFVCFLSSLHFEVLKIKEFHKNTSKI